MMGAECLNPLSVFLNVPTNYAEKLLCKKKFKRNLEIRCINVSLYAGRSSEEQMERLLSKNCWQARHAWCLRKYYVVCQLVHILFANIEYFFPLICQPRIYCTDVVSYSRLNEERAEMGREQKKKTTRDCNRNRLINFEFSKKKGKKNKLWNNEVAWPWIRNESVYSCACDCLTLSYFH